MQADMQNYVGAVVTTLFVPAVVTVGSLVSAARARRRGDDPLERGLRWWLIGGMVVGALIVTATFWLIPNQMADGMGYARSAFQFEVSMTNVAFAVMGVLAVRRPEWRLPVAIGFAVFMWGAMLGHIAQRYVTGNTTAGNGLGIWVYDLVVPAVILVLVVRQRRRSSTTSTDPARAAG